MKVSKRFRWEAAHRLPWHTSGCQNLHGHSYQMWIELKGTEDNKGLLIDFKDIKMVLSPLIEAWDHAVLIAKDDKQLQEAMQMIKSKYYVLPYDTTSENMCLYVADFLLEHAFEVLHAHQITSINVRLQETETCYAEHEVLVALQSPRQSVASTMALPN